MGEEPSRQSEWQVHRPGAKTVSGRSEDRPGGQGGSRGVSEKEGEPMGQGVVCWILCTTLSKGDSHTPIST